MTDRLTSAGATREDDLVEATIRPQRLAEYLGQPTVREQLGIYIEAARRRSEALDHVLIFGPPGLGKTTLSHVIERLAAPARRLDRNPELLAHGRLAEIVGETLRTDRGFDGLVVGARGGGDEAVGHGRDYEG
jgi:Holliday junction DNA helicase RuvB